MAGQDEYPEIDEPDEPDEPGAADETLGYPATSLTPPPGVAPRVYWFARTPTTTAEAEAVTEHIADLAAVLDEALDRDAEGRARPQE